MPRARDTTSVRPSDVCDGMYPSSCGARLSVNPKTSENIKYRYFELARDKLDKTWTTND